MVGGIVGVVSSGAVTQHYTASTSVLVTATGVDDTVTLANSRTTGSINLDTESKIATSSVVAHRVQELDHTTAGTPINALVKPVTVSVPSNTSILVISYESTSPARSARLANDFGRAYLSERSAAAQALLKAQSTKVADETMKLTFEFQSISTQIGNSKGNNAQLALLKNRHDVLRSLLKTLTSQATHLSTTAVTPGRILTSATVPSSPSSPSQTLWGGAGLALGLLIGLAVAWLRTFVHIRARRQRDVVQKLQLPVVADVRGARVRELVPPGSHESQEYRRAYNLLAVAMPEPGVVLVTGRCSSAAVDVVAANLANAVQLSGGSALATSLEDDSVLRDVLGEEAGSLLATRRDGHPTIAEVQALRSGTQYLFVAAAEPDDDLASVQALAAASDAVVLVVEANSALRRSSAVLAQLDAVGAPVFGAVMTTGLSAARPTPPRDETDAAPTTTKAPRAEESRRDGTGSDDSDDKTVAGTSGAVARRTATSRPTKSSRGTTNAAAAAARQGQRRGT